MEVGHNNILHVARNKDDLAGVDKTLGQQLERQMAFDEPGRRHGLKILKERGHSFRRGTTHHQRKLKKGRSFKEIALLCLFSVRLMENKPGKLLGPGSPTLQHNNTKLSQDKLKNITSI